MRKQTLLFLSAIAITANIAAQTSRPAPEPAPQVPSATEAHAPNTPVYPQPQYYNDVTIRNLSTSDQRDVRLSVAFNGWVYAAFSTYDSTNNAGGITICSSRDNGQNWSVMDSYSVPGVTYPAHDIVVCGTDTNSLVLYNAGVNYNQNTNNYVLFVDLYDARTDSFMGSNYSLSAGARKIYDVALASDYMFPAVNSGPFSIGMLYSTYSSSLDSIVFVGSIDGGASWTVRQTVSTTGYYNRKVSLAYGRSNSASNGRYFAAWEQLASSNARVGHIYTAHCVSTVDGTWNAKVNLDSISSTMINLCRDPEIAVQYNNTDNDSGSCTAIVMVARDYSTTGTDYDVLGFYNKRAHYQNFWYRFDIQNTSNNSMQPDVSYDPANNNFLATYYDSTAGMLPYIVTNFNLPTPSSWGVITTQYNDMTTNLKGAYPRVEINPAVTMVAHAWNAEGVNGRGVAMFDAEYVVAGVHNTSPRGGNLISAYPNPTTDVLTVGLTFTGTSIVNIYNSNGEIVDSRSTSESSVQFDANDWSAGMYIVEVINGTQKATTSIVVKH